MTVKSETQLLTVDNLITLWELDFSGIPGFSPSAPLMYLTNNRDATDDISYDGNTFQYIPIKGAGFSQELGGAIPQATLTIGWQQLLRNSNFDLILDEYFTQLNDKRFDWRGVKILRTQIFERFLNDPSQAMESNWLVEQINKQDRTQVNLILSTTISADKLTNEALNDLAANRCGLKYRIWNGSSWEYIAVKDGGCPYGNPAEINNWTTDGGNSNRMDPDDFGTRYFDLQNNEITTEANDICSYNADACVKRFDKNYQGIPFPYTGLLRPTNRQ